MQERIIWENRIKKARAERDLAKARHLKTGHPFFVREAEYFDKIKEAAAIALNSSRAVEQENEHTHCAAYGHADQVG